MGLTDQERLIKALEILEYMLKCGYFEDIIGIEVENEVREVLGLERKESESITQSNSEYDPLGGAADQQREVPAIDDEVSRANALLLSWNTEGC